MQVTVTGRQLDVGDALRSHVEEGLSHAVGKYFDKPMEAAVKFSRNGQEFHADIQVHVGRGILVHGGAEGGDAYGAFNEAAEHIAKRLRRYKRRLRDHHMDEARTLESELAQKFILSGEQSGDGDEDEPAGTEPAVVAELETEVPTLTVGDAVMRMDLANLPAMMFRNPAHGGLNMIYRRPDGNIGWVDPRGVRENTTKA